MLGRRSFMSMIGLAPIAATVKPEVVMSPGPSASSMKHVLMGADKVAGPIGDRLTKRAQSASIEYKRRKWDMDNGLWRSERKHYSPCENISSRKATSPAIKAILQDEYAMRQELERAMFDRRKAVARALAPPWIQSLWNNAAHYMD